MQGQMWPQEREFLHNAVLDAKPKVVLEIGTWKGGGSTYQIATALKALNNSGRLYTCEPDPNHYHDAKAIYDKQEWYKIVTCSNEYSTTLIDRLLSQGKIPDFIFMDGSEDPQEALNDFKSLEVICKPGTFFCMHDWDLGVRADGEVSHKAELLRPYLEQGLSSVSHWKILRTLTAPVSVGIVLAQKEI